MNKAQATRFAALAAALLLVAQARAEPPLREPAPPLVIATNEGRDFNLDAARGSVVLVVFWATWCGPCLAEMPALARYYRKHHAEGFEVIALSTDRPQQRQKALSILARLPFQGALLSDASRNGFGHPDAVPVSFVVDAKGVVRDKFIAIDEPLLDEVVSPLLKEAAAAPIPVEKSK
jgi:peroxiredoxin